MTHIVLENCIKCKFTDCVNVCPVDCFHEGENFLIINPNVCIDCAICIPECPANAIISDENIIEKQNLFKILNFELSKIWPIIIKSKISLENAERWNNIKYKLHLIKL